MPGSFEVEDCRVVGRPPDNRVSRGSTLDPSLLRRPGEPLTALSDHSKGSD